MRETNKEKVQPSAVVSACSVQRHQNVVKHIEADNYVGVAIRRRVVQSPRLLCVGPCASLCLAIAWPAAARSRGEAHRISRRKNAMRTLMSHIMDRLTPSRRAQRKSVYHASLIGGLELSPLSLMIGELR